MQTFLPRHEVVQAALLADPGRLVEAERARRELLGLPPFAALAAVSGAGSDDVRRRAAGIDGIAVGGGDGCCAPAPHAGTTLGRRSIATPRPKGSRLRIEVDPPRRVAACPASECRTVIRVCGGRMFRHRRTLR